MQTEFALYKMYNKIVNKILYYFDSVRIRI